MRKFTVAVEQGAFYPHLVVRTDDRSDNYHSLTLWNNEDPEVAAEGLRQMLEDGKVQHKAKRLVKWAEEHYDLCHHTSAMVEAFTSWQLIVEYFDVHGNIQWDLIKSLCDVDSEHDGLFADDQLPELSSETDERRVIKHIFRTHVRDVSAHLPRQLGVVAFHEDRDVLSVVFETASGNQVELGRFVASRPDYIDQSNELVGKVEAFCQGVLAGAEARFTLAPEAAA